MATATTPQKLTLTAGFGDLDGCGEIEIHGAISGSPIDLTALEDICVTNINQPGSTVTITSANGAILDCDPASMDDIDITAAQLALSASTGVGTAAGSGGALETQVTALEAETNTGGVFITNGVTAAVDLNIGGVSAIIDGVKTGSGNIELVNNGSIILDGAAEETILSNGDVLLQANGATANVEAPRHRVYQRNRRQLWGHQDCCGSGYPRRQPGRR